MTNTALITGASGGIGRDLAALHAQRGGDLVLVARRADALQDVKHELEAKQNVSVHCIALDLIETDAPRQLLERVTELGLEIDVLINNAGFGGHGDFHERDWADDEAMIRLNVMALCEITHLFLKGMVARDRGRILNVASMAAFLPGPGMAVYYATKAFVASFSQAIAEELRKTNITVTALCPGPVKTGFGERADVSDVKGFQANVADSMDVARKGYEAMLKGKLVVTNDWKLSFLRKIVIPRTPMRLLLKVSRKTMEKG